MNGELCLQGLGLAGKQVQGLAIQCDGSAEADLHVVGGGEAAVIDGQGDGTQLGIIETGDHIGSHFDGLPGAVVVTQGQFAAGYIQFALVNQELQLVGQLGQFHRGQCLFLNGNLEGGGLAVVGNGQSLLTGNGIVKSADHVQRQIHLFGGAVVVVQGQLAAGHIQGLLGLQIDGLVGEGCDGNVIQAEDEYIEGGGMIVVQDSQSLAAGNGVIKAADHFLCHLHLHGLAVLVGNGDLAAGHIQLMGILQIGGLDGEGCNGDLADGNDVDLEGGGEPAQGDGQSLGACNGVVVAGDHVSGQCRVTGRTVFIGNSQGRTGHIQLIPVLQVVLLGRLAGQGDGLHGNDFYGIVNTEAFVGDLQRQLTVIGVVKTADHILGDGDGFGLAGVVGQLQSAAGNIQLFHKLQVAGLGRLGGKADALHMFLYRVALQLGIVVVTVTGHGPGAAEVKAAVGGLHQHLGGGALGAGIVTQINTYAVGIEVVAVCEGNAVVCAGSQTGFVLADIAAAGIEGGCGAYIIAVFHGAAAIEITDDTAAVQADVIIAAAKNIAFAGVEGVGNGGGVTGAAQAACIGITVSTAQARLGSNVTIVPAFGDGCAVAVAHNAACGCIEVQHSQCGYIADIVAVGNFLISIAYNTAAAAQGRNLAGVVAMADERVIAAQTGDTAGIVIGKQTGVIHFTHIIATGNFCVQTTNDTAQIANVRF